MRRYRVITPLGMSVRVSALTPRAAAIKALQIISPQLADDAVLRVEVNDHKTEFRVGDLRR